MAAATIIRVAAALRACTRIMHQSVVHTRSDGIRQN
jgi:hypothetical protein